MKKKYFPILILVATIILGVGYASINNILLEITGDLTAKLTQSVVITDIEVYEKVSASNKNPIADETLIQDTITLSSNPTESSSTKLTYKINVYNNSNYDMGYDSTIYDTGMSSEFYSNPNIIFEVKQLTSDNQIIDYPKTSKLPSKSEVTLLLTFKYKDGVTPTEENNTLKFFVNLIYKKWYSVTYKNIENSTLPEGILENDTLTVNLSNDIPINLGVERTNKVSTDYSYNNNILTLNNVTGPVIVHDAYYNVYNNDTLSNYAYTLNEAHSKITSSGEIRTMQDVVDNSTMTVSSGKTINLNTNQNKITTSKTITVNTGGTLNINGNGTIQNDTSMMLKIQGDVTIDDSTTKLYTSNINLYRMIYPTKGTLTINDGIIEGNSTLIFTSISSGGTVNFNGGTITYFNKPESTTGGSAVTGGGTFNLNGGNINCEYDNSTTTNYGCIRPENATVKFNETNVKSKAISNRQDLLYAIDSNVVIQNANFINEGNNTISFAINMHKGTLNVENINIHSISGIGINNGGNAVIKKGTIITTGNFGLYSEDNNSTITLGSDDGQINNDIFISGNSSSLNNSGILNFYDGILRSSVNSFINHGTINTPSGYTNKIRDITIDGIAYKEMYLTPIQ